MNLTIIQVWKKEELYNVTRKSAYDLGIYEKG